jgi:MFS family permease
MGERWSILLISMAIIGFQLAIINLLSYSQWHHFAYLAVSIAMLGFGSSGVILSVWVDFFRKKAESLLPWLFLTTSVLMFITPLLTNLQWFRFDTFLLFTSFSHLIKLFLTCFILFIPFLTGATAIGLFFILRNHKISILYAWNLGGSAAGGVILVILSSVFFPMNLASIFGFVALVACFIKGNSRFLRFLAAVTFLVGFCVLALQPKIPLTSQFKSLSKTLLIPETKVERQIPLAEGTLEFVSSQNLRQANGLSLNYIGNVPLVDMVFLNAQAYFAFERECVERDFYQKNLYALPYFLSNSQNKNVLLLQPSSTFYVTQAAIMGHNSTLVEPLKPIADSLTNFSGITNTVNVINSYPREYLYRDKNNWGIIIFPQVGNTGGAGLGALKEEFLFTTNALKKSFDLLNSDGLLVLSSVMDNPSRNNLKLIKLTAQSLAEKYLPPNEHLVAIRNWNTMLIMASKSAFNEDNTRIIQEFCSNLGFDLVYPPSNHQQNILSDTLFQTLAQKIIKDYKTDKVKDYSFNLKSPTDNSPFFSQFVKLTRLYEYFNWYGIESLVYLELGYFIVWASLLICLILGIIAIAFPLLTAFKNRVFIPWIWIYFSFLGLAYMLLEVSLIQRSILTVGNPIMASALIISSILCFSAIGSYFSSQLNIKTWLPSILGTIGLLIISLAVWGDNLTIWLAQFSLVFKIFVLVLSISPLAFAMGMAFPMGMRILSERYPYQIPIAWGVNGFFSVLAAPIATIIAVELGFIQVLILCSCVYLLCILCILKPIKK